MKYDSNMFSFQYPIVGYFVQHLAYYRAGKRVYDHLALKSPFWCATLDAHLKLATLQWCKVFGADGCNATHWKKTPSLEVEEVKKSFRTKIAAHGFSLTEWKKFHTSMLDFRNKYVAHYEIGFAQPVPDFTKALNVAYAYDEWIRELISPDIYSGQWLREMYQDWKDKTKPLIEAAIKATSQLKE